MSEEKNDWANALVSVAIMGGTTAVVLGILGFLIWFSSIAMAPSICNYSVDVQGSPNLNLYGHTTMDVVNGTLTSPTTYLPDTHFQLDQLNAGVPNARMHVEGQVFCRDVLLIASKLKGA